MENVLEIVVLGQSFVLLWLSFDLGATKDNLDQVIDAHNKMADGFQNLLDMIDEEDARSD